MMCYINRLFFICIYFLFLVGCSNDVEVSGNTMETENSIAIQIFESPNVVASDAKIKIRPSWYLKNIDNELDNKNKILDLEADKNGRIIVYDLPADKYVIECYDENQSMAIEYSNVDSFDVNNSLEATLSGLGKLSGNIQLPDGVDFAWVAPYGIDALVKTDSLGDFVFDKLPTGNIKIISWTDQENKIISEVVVNLNAGDSIDLGVLSDTTSENNELGTWRFLKEYLLSDLTSDWMLPLSSPTIVSLYLDSTNFDFSEALVDGHDFRVFDVLGNSLKIKRTRWEADRKAAKIDIYVEDLSDNLFTMCWGKSLSFETQDNNLWSLVSDSLSMALNSILIDDFETIDSKNSLSDPLEAGVWYFNKSTDAIINNSTEFKDSIVPADSGRSGNAYHLQYSAIGIEWVLIGTVLSDSSKSLSTLDSIVFWCRGNGNYSVSLEHIQSNMDYKKAWTHGSLSENWIKVSITPNQFVDANDADSSNVDADLSNVGWDAIRDEITNINFFASDGFDLWIDDVRIYGINPDILK